MGADNAGIVTSLGKQKARCDIDPLTEMPIPWLVSAVIADLSTAITMSGKYLIRPFAFYW